MSTQLKVQSSKNKWNIFYFIFLYFQIIFLDYFYSVFSFRRYITTVNRVGIGWKATRRATTTLSFLGQTPFQAVKPTPEMTETAAMEKIFR